MSERATRLTVMGAAALALLASAAGAQAPETCTAPQCLAVSLTSELTKALATPGAVDLDALAEGLALAHAGEPLDVRLIVARYDDNRLVRYGVSQRTTAGGEGVAIGDAAATVKKALEPATNRKLVLSAYEGDAAGAATPIQIKSFVGNLPPTNLVGDAGTALIPPGPGAEPATKGSMAIIVLEPEAAEARDGAAAQTFGAVVRLQLVRD